MVAVDLDDLGILRPVVEAVLRQGAEGSKPRAERQHNVGFLDQLHARLGALVAQRSAPQRMVGREGVIVQVGVHHRRIELLGQRDGFLGAAREEHAAAGHDDRELRLGQQVGRLVERLVGTGSAGNAARGRDLVVGLAIEIVARNVELGRAALAHGHVEAARGQFRHARMLGDMGLVFGDLGEDRQLLGLLEAAEAHGGGAGLGRDHHDGRMGPVGGGRRGHEIGDARSVLRDADAMAPRHPRIAVGHVARALFVDGRNEADPGGREQVQRVHVGGPDDAEDILHAIGDQGFDESFGSGHSRHGGLILLTLGS